MKKESSIVLITVISLITVIFFLIYYNRPASLPYEEISTQAEPASIRIVEAEEEDYIVAQSTIEEEPSSEQSFDHAEQSADRIVTVSEPVIVENPIDASTEVHSAPETIEEIELVSPLAVDTDEQLALPAHKTRTIKIYDDITDAMLSYKHWTGRYTPTFFELAVNGTLFQDTQDPLSIQVIDSLLMIRYTYEFMNGRRGGSKEVTFQLDEQCDEFHITFSWKDEWRIIIDHATPLSVLELTKK
jgi:hypothetical protein